MRVVKFPLRMLHSVLVISAIATICASLGLITYFLIWTESAEVRTAGRRPSQYYRQLTASALDDYGQVFGVGHNAGTSVQTIHRAIASGADVIEIDVASVDGVLVSAHESPNAIYGSRVFRGPDLEEVWRASAAANVIQLDLKESTPHFRSMLISFLEKHPTDQILMVATTDVETLERLRDDVPGVFRFLSVKDIKRLNLLYDQPDVLEMLDGVTIRHQLVNLDSVATLKASGLIVLAWTVNDLARVNELVEVGVDGVTTDNLAIVQLLGGSGNGSFGFEAFRLAPEPDQQPTDNETAKDTENDGPGEAHLGAPEEDADFDDLVVLGNEGGDQGEEYGDQNQL